jgi:tRNA(Ile)-lysidine synthetase-like protein
MVSYLPMTENKFLDTFSKFITSDDIIILAISGGVDSMVLLDLVLDIHAREKIIVAHFDHSLRGAESDWDREFIANFCNNNNLEFETEKVDIMKLAIDQKMSIENAARRYRYEFLFRIAEKYSSKYILTAHHSDDRIETAVFNLVRGSKLGGIHALSLLNARHCEERSNPGPWKQSMDCHIDDSQRQRHLLAMTGISIFRPLLSLTKEEIITYAKEKDIVYREDSSNADTDYLRNHLRQNILPEFEKINPEYRRAITNFICYTEELKGWIDEEVSIFLGNTWSFSVEQFEKKSPFFQKEIIRYLYEKANDGTVGLSEGNIEEIVRFILIANGGTEKKLGELVLKKKKNQVSYRHD